MEIADFVVGSIRGLNLIAKDVAAGVWRWRYTPPAGSAKVEPVTVKLFVSDGSAREAVTFKLTVR